MEHRTYLLIIYAGYFISTVILSFLINGLFLKFASNLGIRNTSETIIRWSSSAKPSLGGISFYLIFLLSIASYSIFFEQTPVLVNKQILGLLAACTLAFLLGLSDDAYNTKPFLKLIIQICCGLILISTGTCITLFSNNYINIAFSLFWVVAMMNSINMLDNMDGITTIVSISVIVSSLFVLYINKNGHTIHTIILIGVLSALIGFLFYNWHPAKIFMGDTGSQFLGVFLAAIGILYLWTPQEVSIDHENINDTKQFFISILTFAIPIIDTTTVVINRLRKGKSPFVGGKDHTTHNFFYMGLTEKRIALMYSGVCFINMFLSYLILVYIKEWSYVHILLFSVYFMILFYFFYAPTRKNSK